MTMTKQDIRSSFYEGNTKIIRVTIRDAEGNLKPLENCEITYVITDRTNYDIIILRKQKKAFDPIDGDQIKVVGEGLCDIHINPPDTVRKFGTYRHHLNIVDENNKESTAFTGLVTIHQAPARRYRANTANAYLFGEHLD